MTDLMIINLVMMLLLITIIVLIITVISHIKHLIYIVTINNENIANCNNNIKDVIDECIGYKYVNNKLDKYITLADTARNDIRDINYKLNTIYNIINSVSDTQISDMSKTSSKKK